VPPLSIQHLHVSFAHVVRHVNYQAAVSGDSWAKFDDDDDEVEWAKAAVPTPVNLCSLPAAQPVLTAPHAFFLR
jgi:hypothetical protein